MTVNASQVTRVGAKRFRSPLSAFCVLVSATALAVGVLVLIGWHWDVERLKRIVPGLVSMNPLTAVAFMLAGLSLCLQCRPVEERGARLTAVRLPFARLCAAAVLGIGALRFGDYVFDWGFGIDQVLFADKLADDLTSLPNRMALNTALGFVFLGLALLLPDVTGPRGRRPSDYCAVTVALISLLGLVGYTFDIRTLYGVGNLIPMALHTAGVFQLLALGVLCARPQTGIMAIVTSDGASGLLAGRLFPSAVLCVFLLGWLRHEAELLGLMDAGLGKALFSCANILVFGALVWWSAKALYRIEAEQRAARNALLDSEESLAITLQSIGDAVLSTDAEGRVTRLNAMAEKLTGWTEQEARGHPADDVLPCINEHTRKPMSLPVVETLATGGLHNLGTDALLVARDGTERPIDNNCAPIRDRDGEIVGTVLVIRDETERRRLTEELRKKNREARDGREQLRTVLDTVLDGIISIDAGGRIVTFNAAAERLFGYSAKEVIGRNVNMLMPQPYRREHDGYLENYLKTHEAKLIGSGREVEGLRKDGSSFPMELSVGEMQVDGVPMYTSSVRDISQRRRHFVELTKAREAAEQANRAKSDFLANMSHEIRTPLNAIVGMVELLGHSELNDDQQQMVSTVKESAISLSTLINDIVDLSRIEAGRLEIEHIPISIRDAVEGVADALRASAQTKKLSFSLFIDPAIPHRVDGDYLRLRQILFNLTGNAIKFTSNAPDKQGRVVLRAELLAQEDKDRVRVRFEIIDNGIGLSDEAFAKLFQPFVQADKGTTRRFGGSGLGLSICKRLSQLMEGEIGAESREGVGSRFWVELPFKTFTDQVESLERSDLGGLRILVATDAPEEEDVLRVYLRHWHADVDTCAVNDALDTALTSARAGRPFDLVVLGEAQTWELAARFCETLRMHSETSDLRFVLLLNERRARRRNDSVDYVVVRTKPMRRSEFIRAVAIAAGRESPEVVGLEEPADASDSETIRENLRYTVLIAEDNPLNQNVISRQLNLLGYRYEIASNGIEALKLWENNDYSLLLTDCHMPEMDGYELTERIRTAERGSDKRLPIIAITANALKGEAERCLKAGMDDYLPKPIQMGALKRTLRKWTIRTAEAKPAVSEPEHSSGPCASGEARPAPAGDECPVDVSALRDVLGDGVDAMLEEVLGEFAESSGKIVADIEAAFEQRAADHIATSAHKLKSAAGTIGAHRLAGICQEMEDLGKGHAWDAVESTYQAFVPAYQAVVDYIGALQNAD